MPVNVNDFKLFVEFVSNKVQVGGTVSPDQFNRNSHQAQMQLFERDFQIFKQTEKLTEFLRTFSEPFTGSIPSDGIYTTPSNFQHVLSIRKYFVKSNGDGVQVPVDEIKNAAWGETESSSLHEPTLRFPKYTEFKNTLKFSPKNIGLVEIDYLRTPVKPIWNFSVVSGRPTYNPVGSVDFEWSDFSYNAVAANYLTLIGVNIKDRELSQFSEMYKQQNNSIE